MARCHYRAYVVVGYKANVSGHGWVGCRWGTSGVVDCTKNASG